KLRRVTLGPAALCCHYISREKQVRQLLNRSTRASLIHSQGFENLISTGFRLHQLLTSGQIAFREFLKSEYSEENILFWLACEEYKKIKTAPEMISSANRIYSEFVDSEAPRQINIDCGTRENITKNISQPTLTSFDTAQKLIYSLMARDCYPRFLKSDIYQGLLRRNDSR
uniref:Regulator of G-protein signaling 1 n=1 Tax=Stegastes partitus TaxID=144197 RepID=A0A3B4ZA52_9TELE